ncbi:MAG: hypothetical protein LCH86_22460 [Proteobacteria bacterium]|nr:hypothetical protein [Pseudomonadota bacterium]
MGPPEICDCETILLSISVNLTTGRRPDKQNHFKYPQNFENSAHHHDINAWKNSRYDTFCVLDRGIYITIKEFIAAEEAIVSKSRKEPGLEQHRRSSTAA